MSSPLLVPHLEPVALPRHRILHEPNEELNFAYFPNCGPDFSGCGDGGRQNGGSGSSGE